MSPRSPKAPMPGTSLTLTFDVRAILDRWGIPYTVDRRGGSFDCEVLEMRPMEVPASLSLFEEFAYSACPIPAAVQRCATAASPREGEGRDPAKPRGRTR